MKYIFFLLMVFSFSASGQNIAKGKPVKLSTVESATYAAANAVDGIYTTRCSTQQGLDNQSLIIDLLTTYNLTEVKTTWERACAGNYTIDGSNDQTTWTTLKTVTGNTALVNDLFVTGNFRYLRLNLIKRAAGNTWGFSIFEVEVYGTIPVVIPPIVIPPIVIPPITTTKTDSITIVLMPSKMDTVIMYDKSTKSEIKYLWKRL